LVDHKLHNNSQVVTSLDINKLTLSAIKIPKLLLTAIWNVLQKNIFYYAE